MKELIYILPHWGIAIIGGGEGTMTEQAVFDRETIAERIIKFAQDNNLKIHPGQEPLKWADLLIRRGGHCPCVRDRDHCPCDFVLEDIKELGRCRCGLFANDTYIENYNSLRGEAKKKRGKVEAAPVFAMLPAMNDKARGELLKKISINGFSIEDNGSCLTLHPRGAEATAEITIEDDGVNGWRVVGASGRYTGFAHGQKRSYFESYINRWVIEATLQSQG